MLGNDVVDLGDPETQTRHPGFDARVFSARERQALTCASDSHALRQMLWAAKESAFKAARRQDPTAGFSPIHFETHLDGAGGGRVTHPAGAFQLRISRHGDCVHAIACLRGDPAKTHAGVIESGSQDPSTAARSLALAELSKALRVRPEDLQIARRGRIPELEHHGFSIGVPLSLSHHGRFAAYAALT
jgi:phosphopantetheinyl transferase (holo-ACP synthase)